MQSREREEKGEQCGEKKRRSEEESRKVRRTECACGERRAVKRKTGGKMDKSGERNVRSFACRTLPVLRRKTKHTQVSGDFKQHNTNL